MAGTSRTEHSRLALVGYDFQTSRLRRAVASRLDGCDVVEFDLRRDDYERRLRDFAPHLVVQYGSETTDPPRDVLNSRYRLAPALTTTAFAENAWLPQSAYIYLDWEGLADESSVARLDARDIQPADLKGLTSSLAAYRRLAVPDATNALGAGFILLCLQVPDDTVIRRASPFQDMQDLIDFAEASFSPVPLVVRPHPQDPRDYTARRAVIRRDGPASEWIRRARAVVACNSTTLIEALALGIPSLALGRGLFSGKGVCWEWSGDPGEIAGAIEFRPDRDRVEAFLWELCRRQIPLEDGLPDHSERNPIFQQVRRLLS